MAEVHRLGLRTPEEHRQLSLVATSFVNLNRRRIRLPEILQADADAPTDITYKDIPWRTGASERSNPRTL